MTDEERRKLCKELRADNYADAADEIERLAKRIVELNEYAYECVAEIKWQANQIDKIIGLKRRLEALERM